ncbi:MAG TPA: pentapeptide repeat-containing protein [Tepidisphaeraceae bacterium]|jgi:uncharacterized protein YjbI with pentapeptide repeats|nr:pentapeptide repeat-containing protein [Tepidisphaeraceae bacterium]
MWVNEERPRPEPWREFRGGVRIWFVPLLFIEWCFQWSAHLLSKWAFLEVLEYAGRLSVLIAVIFYFLEAPDRRMQKHYQAWQVINTAQGKSGSGGRIDALQELNADGVPLVGVDVSHASLPGIQLDSADLLRGSFARADLRDASLRKANLWLADFTSANLRGADLTGANLRFATFGITDDNDESDQKIYQAGADLQNAKLVNCNLDGVSFAGVDLRNADLAGVNWQRLHDIRLANIYNAQHMDPAFRAWALAHGAVEAASDADWRKAWMSAPATTAPEQ